MLNSLKTTKIQLLIIVLLTTLAYSNIFQNELVIDDKTFVIDWQITKSFLNTDQFFNGAVPAGHEGVYRPLRSVLYAIYFQLFGSGLFFYHLHSLVVHLGSTILIFFISRQLLLNTRTFRINLGQKIVPFAVALLFGLHPIHTETITYISSAMESIGLTFFLGSFYLYVKFSNSKKRSALAGSLVLALLAFFTTEFTVTLPLVIILYEGCFGGLKSKDWVKKIKLLIPYFSMASIYLVVRFFVLEIGSRGPYLADSIYLTLLTMSQVFVKYLSLTILPLNQANNHTIGESIEAFVYRGYNIDPIVGQSLFDPTILMSLIILTGLGLIAFRFNKKYPLGSFGIGWFFITLLPVSEIVPQGSVMNEKFLYLPSFGVILVLVWGLNKLSDQLVKRNRRIEGKVLFIATIITISVFFGVLSYLRNFDWRNEVVLWGRDVEVYPETNAYAYFQLGNAYLEKNEFSLAVQNYQRAFDINKYFTVAFASIGRVYEKQGRADLAQEHYKKVLETDPSFWEGYRNLADIYLQKGDNNKAREVYEKMAAIYPSFAQDALRNIPKLVEATEAGILGQKDLWVVYHLKKGIGINIPSTWKLAEEEERVLITDDKASFEVVLNFEQITGEVSNEGYVLAQKDGEYGRLVNQGLAKIPQFEWAYVKVFENPNSQSMLFYLINGGDVVKVLVFPMREAYISEVDKILGSIRAERQER